MSSLFVLASGTQDQLVIDLLAILAAAAIVAMLLSRLRLAAIPAYIITGAIIGPDAAQLVSSVDSIESVSQVAILLLMFTIGLHLQVSGLKLEAARIAALGIGSTVASIALLWPLCLLLGVSTPAALAAAMALAMSSTAVVLRLLQQRRETQLTHGRICTAVVISQDLISLIVLAVLPLLAAWAGAHPKSEMIVEHAAEPELSRPLNLVVSAAKGVAGIALMILIGRLVMPRLLREAAKDVSAETLLVLSAAIALAAAAAAGYLGFSPELGAFLAGFLLAGTDFRHQLTGQLAPMRDLFMAVFFTAVGLKLDLRTVAADWWIVALALPVLLFVKTAANGIGTWLTGATAPNSLLVGVFLCQAGEFSLVILDATADLGLLTDEQSGIIVAIGVLSLIVTPGVVASARMITERFAKIPTIGALRGKVAEQSPLFAGHLSQVGSDPSHPVDPSTAELPRKHVIIAGFGVVGRNLAEHFSVSKIPFTVIELNPDTVRRQRRLGRSIVFGDVANPEVLESAGIHDAEAVVLTIPDDDATVRACRAIRAVAPTVFIAARTSFLSRAIQAQEVGADQVTVEEIATARDMATQVMLRLNKAAAKKQA